MTRSEAFRAIVTRPRQVPDDGRIGRKVVYAEPDDQKIRIVRGWRAGIARWTSAYAADHKRSA